MFFEQEFKMTLEDIDKNTYITNKAILSYFENTATYHSDSVGAGMKSVQITGKTWIVLDWRVKVLKRPMYGENLKVRTWSRGFVKFFAYRDYELLNDKGEILAIGTSRWILRDINKHKMALLNEETMSIYESENRTVFPDEEFSKLELPENILSQMSYSVMRRDIDFNRHMHNLYHFDLAYEALPNDIYENFTFDNFRITYKAEIKLGERIKCSYSCIDSKNTIVINNEDNNINSIIQLW